MSEDYLDTTGIKILLGVIFFLLLIITIWLIFLVKNIKKRNAKIRAAADSSRKLTLAEWAAMKKWYKGCMPFIFRKATVYCIKGRGSKKETHSTNPNLKRYFTYIHAVSIENSYGLFQSTFVDGEEHYCEFCLSHMETIGVFPLVLDETSIHTGFSNISSANGQINLRDASPKEKRHVLNKFPIIGILFIVLFILIKLPDLLISKIEFLSPVIQYYPYLAGVIFILSGLIIVALKSFSKGKSEVMSLPGTLREYKSRNPFRRYYLITGSDITLSIPRIYASNISFPDDQIYSIDFYMKPGLGPLKGKLLKAKQFDINRIFKKSS